MTYGGRVGGQKNWPKNCHISFEWPLNLFPIPVEPPIVASLLLALKAVEGEENLADEKSKL
jgi:hypothetical protein